MDEFAKAYLSNVGGNLKQVVSPDTLQVEEFDLERFEPEIKLDTGRNELCSHKDNLHGTIDRNQKNEPSGDFEFEFTPGIFPIHMVLDVIGKVTQSFTTAFYKAGRGFPKPNVQISVYEDLPINYNN